MKYSEESDHTFIIRIWKENREVEGSLPIWRGVIEHVSTGKKRYLQDLLHIIIFINAYFEDMGLKTGGFCWRWTIRLEKLKRLFRQQPSTNNIVKQNFHE